MEQLGQPVKLYLYSTDATTALSVAMFDEDHNAITLGTKDRLVINHLSCYTDNSAAAYIIVFADANSDGSVDTGEAIMRVVAAVHADIEGPIYCPQGIGIKAITDAADECWVFGVGFLKRS